jgi:hypothetical protein
MPTYSKPSGDFVPPPSGLHRAVCVDVIDLGVQTTAFGPKPRVRIVWLIDKLMDTGKPFHVQGTYTNSMHEKALLHQAVVGWRGRPFTEAQMKQMRDGPGFDLDSLIGKNCQLQIIHEMRNGTTYGNVKAILPAAVGIAPLQVPADYVRKTVQVQRAVAGQTGSAEDWPNDDAPPVEDGDIATFGADDDIPF